MRKHSSFYVGLLAVLIAVVMIGASIITAGAATNTIPEEEISAIVNTTTDASQITSPFIDVVNSVRSSVVGVNNYATATYYYGYGYGNGYGQPQESLQGTGSGVVITKYGHVLTNYHVVEGATRVTVTTDVDEEEHEAKVVGYDAKLDIAVLEVFNLDLPAVPLGDSDQLQVGEWAIVIGNPMGERFFRSVSIGAISGLDREVTDRTTDRYGRTTTSTTSMIQTDAAINAGNSGGGMFNILGQLQGIPARYAVSSSSSFFFSSSEQADNIGLCIPINSAKPLIEQVLRDYTGTPAPSENESRSENESPVVDSPLHGKPRLGVTVSTISNASQNVLPQGAFVKSVDENSPAAEGGIQTGDIIVEVDGTVISSSTALTSKLAGYNEGDVVSVKVFRAEGMAKFAEQGRIDLNEIGEGAYIDLTITLRVVDDLNM